MSVTRTQSKTYTVADVRKVVENFAADFSMMAQSTGLRSRESVAEVVSDLKILAEKSYLVCVNLILKDASGAKIRGATYKVSESAIGWTSERPGGNLWPRTPNGVLKVVATLASAWWNMTSKQKDDFVSKNGLYSSWELTTEDTSFSELTASTGQKYASNGYAWQRTNYA